MFSDDDQLDKQARQDSPGAAVSAFFIVITALLLLPASAQVNFTGSTVASGTLSIPRRQKGVHGVQSKFVWAATE